MSKPAIEVVELSSNDLVPMLPDVFLEVRGQLQLVFRQCMAVLADNRSEKHSRKSGGKTV